MLEASATAGMAISQTRTALAHSISYPLTAHLGLEHGFASSFSLPEVLRFNLVVDDGRLRDLALALGYTCGGGMANGLSALFDRIGLKGMIEEKIENPNEILALSPEMYTQARAANNLREVRDRDIAEIVSRSLRALQLGSGTRHS